MAQQPKRPLTSYFIWLGEHRDSIKNENPDLAAKDIAKMAGELWRAISDSEKIKYAKKADEAKMRYNEQMEDFEAKGGSIIPPKKRKVSKKEPVVKKSTKKAVPANVESAEEDESD